MTRGFISPPTTSRYLYVGGLFVVLAAVELMRGWTPGPRATGVLAATVAAVAVSNVAAYRDGGLDGLRRCERKGPVSDMAAHSEAIKEDLEQKPARTVAEAASRIEALTGIRRKPSQVRKFLKGLGLKFQRVRAIPVPPKKVSAST